jgi:hypothetical protein
LFVSSCEKVIGQRPADFAKKIIDRFSFPWYQILDDEDSQIIKRYGINIYPASLLLDPDGVVIANSKSKLLRSILNF